MEMKPKQVEWWAGVRKKGRARFIWVNGVLMWGIGVGVFWAVAMTAIQGRWDHLPLTLPLALVGFMIGGYFFGVWTWKMNEAMYRRAREYDEEDRGRRYDEYE